MKSAFLSLGIMAVPAMLGALLWLVFEVFQRLFRHGIKRKPGIYYKAALLLWFIFLAGLLGLTLTPAGFWPSLLRGELPTIPPAFQGGINLRPFHASWALLRFYIRNGLWDAVLINFPGNIILFMPAGFFTAIFSIRSRWWKSTFWAFFLSMTIEILQLFVSRGTDVDDLILNTLGGFLGFLIFRVIKQKYPGWIRSCSGY